MRIEKQYRFEAAHILPRHAGKCANLHGHSWKVKVELYGPVVQETGFVLDFNLLDELVEPLLDRWDHKLLNCFVRYPTSENIALHFTHALRAAIPSSYNVGRLCVSVSETDKTWAVCDTNSFADSKMLNYGGLEADWTSPDIGCGGADLTLTIGNAKAMLPDLQKKYIDALTRIEQLNMYMQSLEDAHEEFESLGK